MRQALTMAAKPLGLGDHTLSGRISTVMQRMKSSAQCNSLGYTMLHHGAAHVSDVHP